MLCTKLQTCSLQRTKLPTNLLLTQRSHQDGHAEDDDRAVLQANVIRKDANAEVSHQGGHAEDDDGAALQAVHEPVRGRLPRQRDQEAHQEHGHPVVGPAV